MSTMVIAEYTWANSQRRIEWESSLQSYVVRRRDDKTGEWHLSSGLVPVNEVAVMLGAPRHPGRPTTD